MTNEAILSQNYYTNEIVKEVVLAEAIRNYIHENRALIVAGLASLAGNTNTVELYRLLNK